MAILSHMVRLSVPLSYYRPIGLIGYYRPYTGIPDRIRYYRHHRYGPRYYGRYGNEVM